MMKQHLTLKVLVFFCNFYGPFLADALYLPATTSDDLAKENNLSDVRKRVLWSLKHSLNEDEQRDKANVKNNVYNNSETLVKMNFMDIYGNIIGKIMGYIILKLLKQLLSVNTVS